MGRSLDVMKISSTIGRSIPFASAIAFLLGAEFNALSHGDMFPSPWVLLGLIVVGVVAWDM